MISIFDGLSEVADRYDGFIVDLWGVLHDGERAYPAAVECLRTLRERGKAVVILSNAPRRAAEIAARNAEMGIPLDLATAVMSSGEDAWRHLANRPDPWYRALGRRCYHLGPPRDAGMREGIDCELVSMPDEADFVLNTGAWGSDDTVEDYAGLLDQARRRRLPMICANPDLAVMRGPAFEICAGAIAAAYEALGGEVHYHGKPHPPIYETCFELMDGDGVARGRVAAIGDALRTDIAGANAVGIDGIFIAGGLQADELGLDERGYPDPERLAAQCAREGFTPALTLPVLRW